jgi:hypothetical protein
MRVRDQTRGQYRPRPRDKELVMNTLDIHRYTMLVRVREFGAAHGDAFPAGSVGGQMFAAVSTAVDQLSTYVTTQAAGHGAAREGTISKAVAREAVHEALDAIGRTARALALDTPGLEGKFRVPSSRNDHELATAARTFGQDAAPLEAKFTAHGLPATFLADLQAALDTFERAAQEHFSARETHVAARAGIGTAIESAFLALARLDAIVPNILRDKPTMLAAWTSARHVERVRASHEPAPPATPPPATTATTPAPGAPAASA